MRAYIGHIWEQQWGIHRRIHRPYRSSNRACIRAYIGHIWEHTWAIYGGIHGLYIGAAIEHIWAYTVDFQTIDAGARRVHCPVGQTAQWAKLSTGDLIFLLQGLALGAA